MVPIRLIRAQIEQKRDERSEGCGYKVRRAGENVGLKALTGLGGEHGLAAVQHAGVGLGESALTEDHGDRAAAFDGVKGGFGRGGGVENQAKLVVGPCRIALIPVEMSPEAVQRPFTGRGGPG